jgi:thiamine transporter
MNNRSNLLLLVEVAIFTALALLLDFISGQLTGRFWVNGGNVAIGMLPLFVVAFRWGLKGGLLSGFLFGFLQLTGITGSPSIVHPVQAAADYVFAFGVVGFAGLFAKQVQKGFENNKPVQWATFIVIGSFVGNFLRFICHYFSGVVFFGEYAPEGTPAALYSLTYNGGYMSLSFVVCTIVLLILIPALPKKYRTRIA